MTGKPGSGKSRRPARPATGSARPSREPGLALPADLGRSLRLLDNDALDRLVEAAIGEARRRGRAVPEGSPGESRQAEPAGPTKRPPKTARVPDRAGAVTQGQERLILAAYEAGLRPAAIAREFRLSRATVQHVITGAQRGRRKTGR